MEAGYVMAFRIFDQRPGHLGPSADRCRQARRELQVRLGCHRRAALMSDVTNDFTAAIG